MALVGIFISFLTDRRLTPGWPRPEGPRGGNAHLDYLRCDTYRATR
jgi:hypothetical protein